MVMRVIHWIEANLGSTSRAAPDVLRDGGLAAATDNRSQPLGPTYAAGSVVVG